MEEKFDRKIQVKMSSGLFLFLAFESSELRMNKSEYIRNLIDNRKLSNSNISNTEEKEFHLKMIGQISKIGNNLNQIAKALNVANLNENLSDFDYENLINELCQIEAKIDLLNPSNQGKTSSKLNQNFIKRRGQKR